VVTRQGDAYWVLRGGRYLAAGETLVKRWKQLRRLRGEPAGSGAPAREDIVAAWSAWLDEAEGRLCIDVDAEEGGLCLGALLLQTDPDCKDGRRDLFEAVIASIGDVARTAAQQYWIFWDRVHGRRFLAEVSRGAVPKDHLPREHDQVFDHVAERLEGTMQALACALQTPTIALLVPDTAGAIGLLSHVGYLEPRRPHRLADGAGGLTQVFCCRTRAIATDASGKSALQFADLSALEGAHRSAVEPWPPGQAQEAGRLLPELVCERGKPALDGCPRVSEGPFVYANVTLHAKFWPDPIPQSGDAVTSGLVRDHRLDTQKWHYPSGVIKLQGRVPCGLDRGGVPPPRLAPRERRRLHAWAQPVALLLDHLLHVSEAAVVEAVVRDVATALATRGVMPFLSTLATRLQAADVALLRREGSSFQIVAQKKWESPPQLVERLGRALERGELLSAEGRALELSEGGVVRGFVALGPGETERMNCAWVPIGDAEALAVVGAPPELPARRHASATPVVDAVWREERARPFPRLFDATLTMLGHLLQVRSSASARPPAQPVAAAESGPLAVRLFFGDLTMICRGETDAARKVREGLALWLSRARATWKKQECTHWLGISESTLERALEAVGFDTSWRQIPAGTPFAAGEAWEALTGVRRGPKPPLDTS
jgi:hypothetical protein